MANNGRKKAARKTLGRAGGLLGRAGRGLMGRRAQIERAVSGNGNSRKKRKAAPKKKRRQY